MAYDSEVSDLTSDLLIMQRARDRIAARWCHGAPGERPDGAVCISFAIRRTLEERGASEEEEIWDERARLLRKLGFAQPADAIAWNDAPARRKSQVLARFDAAILKLTKPERENA